MLEITLPDGKVKEYPAGTTLLAIANDFAGGYDVPIVEGVFNGLGKDLQFELNENGRVGFIPLNSEEGMHVYTRSLLYLFIVSLKATRPEVKIEVKYTLNSGVFCDIINGIILSEHDLVEIDSHMRSLVNEQEPFGYSHMTKQEAIAELCQRKQEGRLNLLKVLPDDKIVSFYTFKKEKEYFFGPMLPNAGYLKVFELVKHEGGILLRYPEKADLDRLPVRKAYPKLVELFHETDVWYSQIGCVTVDELNKFIMDGNERDIVQMAEALHEKKIANIADLIAERGSDPRVILIAGPSSSGKTTFAQRLSIQMKVNGLKPIPFSLDDYLKERKDIPLEPNGEYDFESLETLDLELFNEHLQRILAGETLKIPHYSFRTGERQYRGQQINLGENGVLLIEGIHGLNERLTKAVPANKKIKIYISALSPLSFDLYNRIQTTDIRLLRRIVRDSQFRSNDALRTLRNWHSVRAGEEKHLFPFQEEADIMFNTTLIYEFAVLKKYAEPLLRNIDQKEAEYTNAQRLLDLLAHVLPIEDEAIPNNSIIREFVGNSIFKDVL